MHSKLYKFSALLFSALIFFTACEKEYETIEEVDAKNIENYITANGLNGQFKDDTLGIKYKIIKEGTGKDLMYSEIVPLIFTVRSLDGKYVSVDTFAASNRYGIYGDNVRVGYIPSEYLGYFGSEKGYPNALKRAVVELLKKRGGEIRVLVPSKNAYGRNGFGSIPGNASLDYTIKVLNENKIAEYDDQSIQKYLNANGLTGFSKTSTGLYYKITATGEGSEINLSSTITFSFTGKYFNNAVFQKVESGTPAKSLLEDLIPAFQQGIPLIKRSGQIRLIIPSSLGYGFAGRLNDIGNVDVPTAACLDFDINVIEVE